MSALTGLIMLDCFSGSGGASAAMRARGWHVVRIDADPTAHQVDVVADLRTYRWPRDGGPVDLLWASPPCDEFAREFMPWSRTGRTPDLSCVNAVYRLVDEVQPRWWILENVKGAQPYLGWAAWCRNPVYLWGHFPPIELGPLAGWKERLSSERKRERAAIPWALSLAVAQAVEASLPLPLAT